MEGSRRTLLAAAVFMAAFALFAVSIAGSHLSLDDWGYVYGCPFVKGGLSWNGVRGAFATVGHGGIWMPLTSMTYMADISLWGEGWTSHHVVNVFLHALNAVLVFRFLLALLPRFLKDGRGAPDVWCAFAALLWACSPARSEAVAWVASRKEELWTLFSLCGLLAWLRWLDRGRLVYYAVAFACFVLACLSKPTAMCFPVLAWLVHRFAAKDSGRRMFLPYLPMLAFSAFVGLVALVAQARPAGMAEVELYGMPFGWRLLNAAVSTGLYLFHAFVPYGVHADCRAVEGGWPLGGALGLAALAVATVAVLILCRRSKSDDGRTGRLVCFCAFWFLASLLPVLGVFGSVGDTALAERYSYLPSVCLALAAAYAFSALSGWRGGRVAAATASVLLAAQAAASVPVTMSYADDVASAERTLAFDPDNWRALRTLGKELAARGGRMDEGVEMLRRSLRLRPSRLTADSLAYMLACRGGEGDFAEVRRLGRAVVRRPKLDVGGMMLDALGIVAMREGDDEAAVKFFSESLVAPARSYSNVHTMLNLGLSLANSGKRAEAAMMLLRLHSVSDEGVRARVREALDHIKAKSTSRLEWR